MPLRSLKLFGELLPILAFRATSLALTLGISVYLARALGPSGYGAYALAIAVFTVVQPIAGGGLGTLAIRELSNSQISMGYKQSLISGSLGGAAAMSLFVGGILAFCTTYFFPDKTWTVGLGIVLLPSFVFIETMRGILTAQGRVRVGQLLSEVLRPSLFLAGLYVLVGLTASGLSATGALLLFAGVSWTTVATLVAFNSAQLGSQFLVRFKSPIAFQLLRKSFPFALIAAAQYINTRFDIIALGFLLSEESAGTYQVATKISALIGMPASLLLLIVMPRISKAFGENDNRELVSLFWKTQLVSVSLAIPIFVLLVGAANPIISFLFGPEYLNAIGVLVLLSIVQLLTCGMNGALAVMTMTGQERTVLAILSITVLGNIVLNTLLVPYSGIMGAAYATAAMAATTFILLSFSLYRSGVLSSRIRP